ncbi:GntR family transcriptional regulator [Parapusillimonas granuli]|uniref:GntR family transcriptional regulator n=1 Tax=Parapusillimonas granuli TaxID=380911 RepID=A0A853FT75_9BURK|nr:GntR family transcriptional regulator [Parapusillimonas granuli]MBB5214527.1 DNA-binding GntR family transcriptional regulator [Parapusillimonas granuli]NYT49065.1 GntR family transcriptional regulator [Parapusillimonas granuli]
MTTYRPTPLQRDLARRIAAHIADGSFPADSHLREEALADMFQVSRTPIRGALKLLASHGAIHYRSNSGYFVHHAGEAASLPALADGGASADALYRALIQDRARKRLPDTLIEKDLLRRYGCSAAVLRNVLSRMTSENLIEKRPGRGWQFMPALDSREALTESYRYRIIIECGGLLEPGFQPDAEDMRRSRAAFTELLTRSQDSVSAAEFFRLNASFHEMLARFSGNRFIVMALQQQTQLRRLEEHDAFYRHDHVMEASREHLEILDAIESKDPQWAAALMRKHLLSALAKS